VRGGGVIGSMEAVLGVVVLREPEVGEEDGRLNASMENPNMEIALPKKSGNSLSENRALR
jgi:hypothetical protein